MRPTAFVCGPYINTEQVEVLRNIESAKVVAVWLWDEGYYVFCPHMNTANFHKLAHQSENVYKQFAFSIIRSGLIDLIVLTPAWKSSSGARDEVHLAQTLKIPIFEFSLTGLTELK